MWLSPTGVQAYTEAKLYNVVQDWMNHAYNQGSITSYVIQDVISDSSIFKTVSVDKTAKPGDSYKIGDEYLGIIVAIKKENRKRFATVLLSNPAEPGNFVIKAQIQPARSVEYIVVTLSV